MQPRGARALLLTIIALTSNACGLDAHALPKDGPHLFAGKRLYLNGRGLHEATIFKVDVYSASLFLESPSNDPEKIISSSQLKVVEIEFHRDVSHEEVKKAWLSDLRESCSETCDTTIFQASSLLRFLPDVKAGQKITYFFYKTQVEIHFEGKRIGELNGNESVKAVLSAFIGKKTPAEKIRAALLGQERST